MGNSIPKKESIDHTDDLKWLNLTHENIFHDKFVENLAAELADFELPSSEKDITDDGDEAAPPPAPQLMQLFAGLLTTKSPLAIPTVKSSSSMSFGNLKTLQISSFLKLNRLRLQLLLRIHTAHLHQKSKVSKSSENREGIMVSNLSEIRSSEKVGGDLLTAATLSMSLSILETLGSSHPQLFDKISSNLISLYQDCYSSLSKSPLSFKGLETIFTFAETSISSNPQCRQEALTLLFSTAVVTGSLGAVLKSVSLLLSGPDNLAAHAGSAIGHLEQLSKFSPYDLTVTTVENIHGSVQTVLDTPVDKRDLKDYQSSCGVDGTYLYVWHGLDQSLYKIGSGFHHSIPGNVYEKNSRVRDQLLTYLGKSIYKDSAVDKEMNEEVKFVMGWVACVGNRLFLRLADDILGPFRLAIFSASSLSLLEIIDIPIRSFREAKHLWLKSRNITGTLLSLPESDKVGHDNDIIEWEYAEEMTNISRGTAVVDKTTVPLDMAETLMQWEPSLSSRELIFSNSNSTAKRNGNMGCYPCSNIDVTDRLVTMTCQLGACPSSCNRMSVGIAVSGHSSNAYGDTSSSWGISHEAGSAGNLRCRGTIVSGCEVRKLKEGDQYRLRYDPTQGTMLILFDSADGDFSSPEISHEFQIHAPGETKSLVMGASYANDYELTLVDNPQLVCAPAVTEQQMATISVSNCSELDDAMAFDLLCKDSDYSTFCFDERDVDKELIVCLQNTCSVVRVGCLFSSLENSYSAPEFLATCSVHVSSDGEDYIYMGDINTSNLYEDINYADVGETDNRDHIFLNAKYVRLQFTNVRSVSHIRVLGYVKHRKVIAAPVLAMTTDGQHLLFLNAVDKKDGMVLESYLVDPSGGMVPYLYTEYDLGSFPDFLKTNSKTNMLLKCSFVFNGDCLLLSFRDIDRMRSSDDKNKLSFSFIKYDVTSGQTLSSYFSSFPRDMGFPCAMSYDVRNNMVWGWSAELSKFIRWRGHGVGPRVCCIDSSEAISSVVSLNPSIRVKALRDISSCCDKDFKAQGAFLLALLDKISFLFGPRDLTSAESYMLNEIRVSSSWSNDANICEFLVRGQFVHKCSDGFNLVCLDNNFAASDVRTFDTVNSTTASEEMARYINTEIRPGNVVLVSTMGNAARNLSGQGKAALRVLGAKNIENLTSSLSFSMISVKGMLLEVSQMMSDKPKCHAVVRRRIPPPAATMSFELSETVFHVLVTLVHECYWRYKNDEKSETVNISVLISALNLLITNTFHLLSSVGVTVSLQFLCHSDRELLKNVIDDIRHLPNTKVGSSSVVSLVLKFNTCAIDLLSQSEEEKFSTLVNLLHFVNATDIPLESFVLQNLIREFTPAFIASCCEGGGDGGAKPIELFVQLLHIADENTKSSLSKLGREIGDIASETLSNDGLNGTGGRNSLAIGNVAVELLSTVCNVLLSHFCQRIISPPSIRSLGDAINSLFAIVTQVFNSSISLFSSGLKVIETVLEGVPHDFSDQFFTIFEASCVCTVFPMILSSFSLLFEHYNDKLTTYVTQDLVCRMKECASLFNEFTAKLPSQKNHTKGTMSRQETHIFESEHPYRSNTRESYVLNYPGASKMTISFDPESKTEPNCDYVRIWKDSAKSETWHPGLDKLTGRRSSAKWPGVGELSPLEIDGSSAFVEFYSDSSDEDWGWKFEVVVDFKGESTVSQHWILNIEDQLCYSLASIAKVLMTGVAWVPKLEDTHQRWLTDPLFLAGFSTLPACQGSVNVDNSQTEISEFLHGFLDRSDESLAAKFCQIMKSYVLEDQGNDEIRNRAVYLSCAVIIYHNNLAAEAFHLAKNPDVNVLNPSDGLIDAWKYGQTLRSCLNFGQVETIDDDDEMALSAPSLVRGGSIYSETKDADIVLKTVNQIVSRGQFLLCLQSDPEVDVMDVLNSAPNINLNGDMSFSTSSLAEAFRPEMMSKFQAMQVTRRKKLEKVMNATVKKKSERMSERIMRFLKGNTSMIDLQNVCDIRSERAEVRALGLQLMACLITSESAEWVEYMLAITQTVFTNPSSSRIHYLNAIEGCSSTAKRKVMSAFVEFTSSCVKNVKRSSDKCHKDKNIPRFKLTAWKHIAICSLKGLCMDFTMPDFCLLHHSNVLNCFQEAVQFGETDLRATTLSVTEFFLARHLYVERQQQFLHPAHDCLPTSFKKELIALIIGVFGMASAGGNWSQNVTQLADMTKKNNGHVVIPRSTKMEKNVLGFQASGINISIQHSIALWIYRPRCFIDDIMDEVLNCIQDESSVKWAQLGNKLHGMKVTKGPHWEHSADEAALGEYGIICNFEVKTRTVLVEWEDIDKKKVKKSYLFGASVTNEIVYQVSLADEGICGQIYCKGMRLLHQQVGKSMAWNAFGLSLCADATLQSFIDVRNGKDCNVRSVVRLGPEVWTHVCIVQNNAKSLMYLDGKQCGEIELEESLTNGLGESKELKESPLYIGQTPFYVDGSDDKKYFNGTISDMCIFGSKSLTVDEVMRLADCSKFPLNTIDEMLSLQVLHLLHKESVAIKDFVSILLHERFSMNGVLVPLLAMLGRWGSSATKCGALALCASLLPVFSPNLVDQAAVCAGILDSSADFLEFAMQELGKILNSQAKYKNTIARSCSEDENAIGVGYLKMFSELFTSLEWVDRFDIIVKQVFSSSTNRDLHGDVYNNVLSVVALCGGENFGLCSGANGRYQHSVSNPADEGGGMLEDCTILAPSWPPTVAALEEKWRGQESSLEAKAELALWENKVSFSDAFYVTLTSQPLSPVLVPMEKLFPVATMDTVPLESIVKTNVDGFVDFFRSIIQTNCRNVCNENEINRSNCLSSATAEVHLKFLSMVAFNKLVKSFSWFAFASSPILRTLVDVTLIPVPERPVPPSPPKVKPIVMESKHDYDHNANDYFPINIPGAKTLKIVFHPDSRSERNYDYMRFYKDDSHSEYYGQDKYTGGRGNWPGTGSTPPLIIPANSCVIYWRTDSSGNDWGWKLTISVHTYKIPQQSDVGFLDIAQCKYYLRYLYLAKRDEYHRCTLSCTTTKNSIAIVTDDIRPNTPQINSHFDERNTVFDLMEAAKSERFSNIHGESLRLRVNASVVLDGRVSLLADASPSSEILHVLSTNECDSFQVLDECNDWVKVCFVEVDDSKEGWVRRRQSDVEYLVPLSQDSVELCSLENLENDVTRRVIAKESCSQPIAKTENSMFQINETCCGSGEIGSSSIDKPIDVLLHNISTLNDSIIAISMMGVLSIAQDCISEIFSISPEGEEIFMSCFETPLRLLDYIKTLHQRSRFTSTINVGEKERKFESVVKVLKQFECHNHDMRHTWNSLMFFSLDQLSFIMFREAKVTLPPSLGVVNTLILVGDAEGRVTCTVSSVDSSLPSINVVSSLHAMTGKWVVTVPAAKCLHFKLEPCGECAPDALGSVIIDSEVLSEGANASVIVQGESSTIEWEPRQGAIAGEWTVRVVCSGQMTGPSKELRNMYIDSVTSSDKPCIELACWLLKFLCRKNTRDIQTCLWSAVTIAGLRKFLESVKSVDCLFEVVQLVLSMFSQRVLQLPTESIGEVSKLKTTIIDMCNQQLKSEGKNGTSKYLQSLIECSLMMSDYVVELESQSRDVRWETEDKLLHQQTVEDIYSPPVFSAQEYAPGGSRTFHVRVNSRSSAACEVAIGVMSSSGERFCFNRMSEIGSPFTVALMNQELIVCFPSLGNKNSMQIKTLKFGPQIFSGDIVSVKVDLVSGRISFFRNSVLVGIAVGPAGSGAAVELNMLEIDGSMFFMSCIKSPGVSLSLLQSLSMSMVDTTPSVKRNHCYLPEWLHCMQDVVHILKSSQQHAIPRSVLVEEFLPICETKSQVSIHCESYDYDVKKIVEIPHADSLSIALDSFSIGDSAANIVLQTPIDGEIGDVTQEIVFIQENDIVKLNTTLPLFDPSISISTVKKFRHSSCAALMTCNPETDKNQCAACHGYFKVDITSQGKVKQSKPKPLQVAESNPSVLVCAHHECILQLSADHNREIAGTCDVCNDEDLESKYFCDDCDFDVCEDCFEIDVSSRHLSKSTCDENVTDPPAYGDIIAVDHSCLTSSGTQGGCLRNVFDLSETNYWEEVNSSEGAKITISLSEVILKDLGEEYCLEFFNANIGGAYDPDKIVVRIDDKVVNEVVAEGSRKRWMKILTSSHLGTALSDGDHDTVRISIHFHSDGCNFKVTGLRFVCTRESPHLVYCSAACEQNGQVLIPSNSDNIDELRVGDFVVRAPDWNWGDEDGGAGNVGTVVKMDSWKGESNAGVRVKWQRNNIEGLYRWNAEYGICDVALLMRCKEANRVLKVPCASLTFELNSNSGSRCEDSKKDESSCVKWHGSAYFNGSTSMMQLPSTSDMDFVGDFTVEAWVKISPTIERGATTVPILSRRIETDSGIFSNQFSLSLNLDSYAAIAETKEEKMKGLKCALGHDMLIVSAGSKHPQYSCGYAQCNVCSSNTSSSEDSYFCAECEYDMCCSCGSRNISEERPSCPAGHITEILAVGADPVAYGSYGSGAAQCDCCGEGSLNANGCFNYHCAQCQFDMCRVCGTKALDEKSLATSPQTDDFISPVLMKPTCGNGHEMTVIDAGSRVSSYTTGSQTCDHCRAVSLHKNNLTNYNCEKCKYDFCHDCGYMSMFMKKYPFYRLKCRRGHNRKMVPKGPNDHTCVQCRKTNDKMPFYFCDTCRDAVCGSCAKSTFVRICPRMNKDGVIAELSSNKSFYCGRKIDCCVCGSCDGHCGPKNGCACSACAALSEQYVVMAPHCYHSRVRRGQSFETDQIGLIMCDYNCHFVGIKGNWAKIDPCEYSVLSKGENFVSHDPAVDGYCALLAKDGDRILFKEGFYFPPLYELDDIACQSRNAEISFTTMNIEMKTAVNVTGGSINVGKWAHICVVVKGSVTSIYVDGVKMTSSSSMHGQRMGGLGAPLCVGFTPGLSSTFNGHIFDLRLWKIARSESDILKFKDNRMCDADLFASLLLNERSLDYFPKEVIDEKVGAPQPVITSPELSLDITWDEAVEQAKSKPGEENSVLKCLITPKFSLNTIIVKNLFPKELSKFSDQYAMSKLKVDKAMVRFINAVALDKKLDITYLLKSKWKDLVAEGQSRRSKLLLSEYLRLNASSDSTRADARFSVLQRLNKALLVVIPYFDLCTAGKPGTLSHMLCSMRGLIFNLTKDKFWSEALSKTEVSHEKFKVNISRSRATKHALTGVPDHEGKMMVFSQAFRQIHPLPPRRLRRKNQLYNTIFMGEHSNDAGGPYSESFAMMCLELQSSSLPLFIRTRNGVGNIGQNKEKWVLNPAAKSSLHMEMFSFLGKLMAIAIRSKEYLGLNIPSIIWKLLVRDVPSRSDLEAINISYIQSLDRIREYDENTMAYMEQTFTLTTWDNREVELIPGGSQELVTFESRDRYCDLCEQYCLHEFDEQAAAVRLGLSCVVPPHLLSLYSWQEFDHMVCGNPVIDVVLLEAMTTYQNCSSTDKHIRNFWNVLEDYSEEEKSAFLRFTWGRSRLPLSKEGFSRKLKIEAFTPRGRSTATQDESLPVSHTCFFSLELPKYSTIEILREKLTYAITNCVAIDVDNDSSGQSAAGMGWVDF